MTHKIEVRLSQDFRKTCMGYDPEAPYGFVISFEVTAPTPEAAADVAFSVTNSYPEEMHCSARYAGIVKIYRALQYRSVSVGDVVVVDGAPFACEAFGWRPLAAEAVAA